MAGRWRIVEVSPSRIDEATEVLVSAHGSDPLFSTFLGFESAIAPDALRPMFAWGCARLVRDGHVVLAACEDDAFIGIGCADRPERSWNLLRYFRHLRDMLQARRCFEALGRSALTRLVSYEEMTTSQLPRGSLCRVHYLGVLPSKQGRGIGRRLLAEIEARPEASQGVVLSTWHSSRCTFFEACGYALLAHAQKNGVDAWTLVKRVPDL